MTLIYEDHFDNPTLDTSKWGHTMGIYTIQDSNLILGGNGRGGEVRGYRGSNPFAMKYGYIEIRAKFGGAGSNKGFVNQLWLIHRQDEFEIDITETPTGPIDTSNSFYGINKINSSYHYYNYSGYRTKQYNTGIDLSKDYHVYAVEWTKDYIRYLFDNKEYYRVTSSDVAISNLDMYIILGLCAKCKDEEAAGCWSSQECASGDAKLYIDYVRIYDQMPSTKKYKCTGAPDYQCIEDPNGPYNSLTECQAACKPAPTKYKCTGSPDYQCIEDPNGPYNSLTECQAACKPAPTKYKCTGAPNYQCIEDPNGPYNSLTECQAACKPAPQTKKFKVQTVGLPSKPSGVLVMKSTRGDYMADDACKLTCDTLKNMDQ